MKKILWIHGFCGRPNNENIEYMKKLYSQYDIYAIEVDHHAKASLEKINTYIKDNNVDLVAGTSLGGFYTMCADFDGPKLVVNPAMEPIVELRQFIGKNSYKPGRPDGQRGFDFTESMLEEFGELTLQPLNKTICHYTPHDNVLGEDAKQKYKEHFFFLQEMDKKILPGHFLSKTYIKEVLGKTFDQMLSEQSLHWGDDDMYFHYGMDYMDVPRELWNALSASYSLNSALNAKKILHDIEATLCKIDAGVIRRIGDQFDYHEQSKSRVVRILLEERKRIMTKMFHHSEDSFRLFIDINQRLQKMSELMKQKLSTLYKQWLDTEEKPWKNDCQIVGTIKTDCDRDGIEGDETGSMFATMLSIIEHYNGNELLHLEFSGAPDRNGQEWFSIFDKEILCWKFYENDNSFGNFLMCSAFKNLWEECLFAPQDILRISTYWCDAYVVHQCIVDQDGNFS